jgi:transposase-like protein
LSSSILKQRLYKSYPPEFRTQAIKLALTKEKTIAQTAKDLGVPIGTLNSWVRRAEKGEWTVPDENLVAVTVEKSSIGNVQNISQKLHEQLGAEQRRSAELERQVKRLTQEREILKKAMAYCLDVPK